MSYSYQVPGPFEEVMLRQREKSLRRFEEARRNPPARPPEHDYLVRLHTPGGVYEFRCERCACVEDAFEDAEEQVGYEQPFEVSFGGHELLKAFKPRQYPYSPGVYVHPDEIIELTAVEVICSVENGRTVVRPLGEELRLRYENGRRIIEPAS